MTFEYKVYQINKLLYKGIIFERKLCHRILNFEMASTDRAFVLLLLAVTTIGGLGDTATQSRLFNDLFVGYNMYVIPLASNDTAIVCKHDLALLRVNAPVDGVIKLDVWETLTWIDVRLQWDPVTYDGISSISVPASMIWTPDMIAVNVDKSRSDFDDARAKVIVISDGQILYVRDRCLFAYVQKDEFSVELKFMSWTYNGFQLDIQMYTDDGIYSGVDMANFVVSQNGIEVRNTTKTRNEYRYSCCPETFPDMTYYIELKEPHGWWF